MMMTGVDGKDLRQYRKEMEELRQQVSWLDFNVWFSAATTHLFVYIGSMTSGSWNYVCCTALI